MDTKDFIQLLKKKKTTVITIIMFFVIAGLIITLAQPLKYQAKSRLLILQPNTGNDAYLTARSNEYIGGLISEVVYSGSFLDSLKNSNYIFDRNYFGGSYKDSIKKWRKTISTKNSGDTGVINIEVFHTDPEEAKKISQAVNELIISGQSPYRFNSEQIKISIIDQPITSSFPVKPNLPLTFVLSIVFGLMTACSYVYLFPEESINIINVTKPNYQPTPVVPAIGYEEPSPIIQANSYEMPAPTVPDNLPIFDSENNYQSETPFQFQGHMSNVLGE